MWYAGQGVGHDEQRQSRTVPKKNRNRNRREGTGTGSEACWVVTVESRAEIGTETENWACCAETVHSRAKPETLTKSGVCLVETVLLLDFTVLYLNPRSRRFLGWDLSFSASSGPFRASAFAKVSFNSCRNSDYWCDVQGNLIYYGN